MRPSPGSRGPPSPPTVRGGASPIPCCPPLSSPQRNAPSTSSSTGPGYRSTTWPGLLAVSDRRASQLVTPLEGFGLVTRAPAARGRLALTDRGLAMLARRDRASVGVARSRWSVAPLDAEAPFDWRNVTGRRSRQLLRNIEHTEAVHGFIAALARQSSALRWEMAQLDPPRRASRYFRREGRLRSIHPDAFGILRRGPATRPFFLEWERRAVRPTTMAARLAPYLLYYSSHRPTDDHGVQPAVLMVFDDDLAATHFLRVALEEMDGTRVRVPLWVSHRGALDALGPLGRAWRTPETGSPPTSSWALNIRCGTAVERRLSPRPERRF